jgi:hypothetical protein
VKVVAVSAEPESEYQVVPSSGDISIVILTVVGEPVVLTYKPIEFVFEANRDNSIAVPAPVAVTAASEVIGPLEMVGISSP